MRKLFLVMLLCLLATPVWAQRGYPAKKVGQTSAGTPGTGCSSVTDVGNFYARTDGASSFVTLYVCGNTGAGTYSWELYGGGVTDADLLALAALNCSSGQYIKSDGSNTWSCGTFGTATNAQTGASYTIAAADCTSQKLITFTNASAVAVTLLAANNASCSQQSISLQNIGDSLVTVTRASTDTLTGAGYSGATSIDITPGQRCSLLSDGTSLWTVDCGVAGPRGFTYSYGDPNGSALAATADYPDEWLNDTGRTLVISAIKVWCDATDASTTVNVQRDDGSAASIATSDVACNTAVQTATLSATEKIVANGDKLSFITVTANTAKVVHVQVTFR